MNKRQRALIVLSDILALKNGATSELDARVAQILNDNIDYYGEQIVKLARERYDGKITDAQFIAGVGFLITAQIRRAARDAMRDIGVDEMDVELENEIAALQTNEQNHVRELLLAILIAMRAGKAFETLRARLELWKYRYLDMYNRALIAIGRTRGKRLVWRFGATEKHCKDCAYYEGQVKNASEWDEIFRLFGHRPQSPMLACGGWRCDCRLEVAK
ncbi:MAG: hypothetical protein ACOY4M_08390 [Pseudomonadota bacterium]